MGQKSLMSAAELESMIMAELREHPERQWSLGQWALAGIPSWSGDEPPNVECKARLDEITNRLRHEFELAE
jgi:hypothetical protein